MKSSTIRDTLQDMRENIDTQTDVEKSIESFKNSNLALLEKVDTFTKNLGNTPISYVHSRKINRYASNVFIMIVTANEIERKTLLSYFWAQNKGQEIVKIPRDGIVYTFFKINDFDVVHVEPESIGSYTYAGTAETLKKALKRIKPSIVLSLGVAFGSDYKENQLGDVLIGRQFYAYDKAVKVKKNDLSIKKLHILEASETLLYRLKSCSTFEHKNTGFFENTFKVELGNMITGEYVVDSISFRKMIFSPFKAFGIIGGEMEAFGIFNTLKQHKKVHGMMMKGICDWGAGKNDIPKSNNDENNSPSANSNKQINQTPTFPDFKNNLQVLAMLNTCSVCHSFLHDIEFFSDFGIFGLKKCFWRICKKIHRFFTPRSKK